eukprot:TRINITY_DN6055_c0_g1_i1.p1 TRINITY_DN6055_c0_g1~~TRINITY_DN6055_c0_g1_i1.p1  ORF type:complete len:1020 (-),score=245.31 TRINITY_DN6055_c0_g1_i1:1490-4549(-)
MLKAATLQSEDSFSIEISPSESDSSSDSNLVTENRGRVSKWFRGAKERALAALPDENYFKSRQFKNVVKSMVAFLLCTLCTLIVPLARFIGDWNFLACAAMIFVEMDQSLGGIFERFWIFVLVMGVTAVCSWGTMITTYTCNAQGECDSKAIVMLSWMITFTLVLSWMRAKFNIRWTSPITNALEVFFLTVISGKRKQDDYHEINGVYPSVDFHSYIFPFITATMTGVVICFGVTTFVYPFSSTQLLQKEMVKTFGNAKKLLELNLKCFSLEASQQDFAELQVIREAVDSNSTKLANFLHDAKIEIARSYFSNEQKKNLVFFIRQLLVQSTAMTSCFQKDTAATKKNEVLQKFIDGVNPALRSLLRSCTKADDLLEGFFQQASEFDPRDWSDLIAEMDAKITVLNESMTEAADKMSEVSPVILSSKGHKRIRSFGRVEPSDLEGINANTSAGGISSLLNSKVEETQSNHSWEAIFRVNFFVASCEKLTSDHQKLLQFILDIQKLNMGRKTIHLPSWLSNFRKTKKVVKNGQKEVNTNLDENVPLASNVELRTESNEPSPTPPQSPRRHRRSQSIVDSINKDLSDLSIEAREAKMKKFKIPSSAQLSVTVVPKDNVKTLGYKIWQLSTFFTHTDEAIFAFKTALTIYIASIFFFLPATSDFWMDLRAEWALFTITALTSMTVGGNMLPSLYRVGGTIVGALWAIASWKATSGNPFGLFVMCTIFGMPMFHLKLNSAYPRVGSVGLTTYVIILYGKFNKNVVQASPVDETIEILALKRSGCIFIGIALVFLVNRFVMPHLARRDLRISISKTLHLCSDLLGMVTYQFLQSGDLESKTTKESNSVAQRIQLQIAAEKSLVVQSISEPRLKGPFPHKMYSDLISSVQFIFDRILTLKLIIAGSFSPEVRRTIINPLNELRKDMTITIVMLIWIMAESVRSKSPMPQHLPNAMKARNELINAFQKLPTVQLGQIKEDLVEDYLLVCGYIESQKDLILEIHKMVGIVKALFGEKKVHEEAIYAIL